MLAKTCPSSGSMGPRQAEANPALAEGSLKAHENLCED